MGSDGKNAFPPAPRLPKPSAEERALLDLLGGLRREISTLQDSEAAAHAEHLAVASQVIPSLQQPAVVVHPVAGQPPPSGQPPPGQPPSEPPPQPLPDAGSRPPPAASHHRQQPPPAASSHHRQQPPKQAAQSPPAAFGSSFTTLGLPPCSVKAAVALDGAEHHEPERPFAPYINPTSAKLRRDVPVHEMLLGKGAASKQKLERTAAQLLEEDLRACKRTQPTPRATEELAQRYSERVGQSAKERLIAPRQVSLERAMEDDQQRSSALRPFSPVRSTSRLYEAGAFRTVPASDASPSSSSLARLSRSARPSRDSREGAHPTSSRGSRGPALSAVAVAERSAVWKQLREQKVQQHKARLRRSEEAQCTFKPAVDKAAAASAHDVVSRCRHWQEQRDRRLQAAIRREMEQVALEHSPSRVAAQHRGRASSPGAEYATWAGAEPRFMAPTVAAREREALAIIPSLAWEPPEHADMALPEWAAPRAQHVA